ncbi:hypothetical protein LBMAG42_32740 [Deltaproteobacteria bacterium]|nr:hypothetical protein LBMAG42_32740 [Deltaproteobacteria bacterium]
MLLALLIACPICGGKPPEVAPPVEPSPIPALGTGAAEPVPTVSLPPVTPSDKPTPPCSGLEPRLWPLVTSEAPVLIVVDGSFIPPDWLTMDAAVDSVAQGTVPGTRLCELAAIPGVIGVRPPMLAHPKLTP